ncbi:MAG: hypothetical protein JWO46_1175 [Nocardioidaceae bacterium]|nr:hypothetical protein [Nocardioidaceae bacterium]
MLPNYFDTDVAAGYDDPSDPANDPGLIARTADVLTDLAGPGGRALELAIGTGRIALPLAQRGVDVRGIELSQAMVDQMRAKPGGADLPVAIGDMATTRVDGVVDLVYLVFNTLGNVTSQDGQVAVFENAAAHLRAGGRFLVEISVPGIRRVVPGAVYRVFHHADAHHGIDEYDPVTQQMFSHHYTREDDGRYRRNSVPFRFVWPSEMDLMARIAGMRLRERWADWDRAPFTAASTSHVSVWEKG